MTPSHIVVVTDSVAVDGGSGKVAISSAIGLAERGFDVTLFGATGAFDPAQRRDRLRVVSTDQGFVLDRPTLASALRGIWNGPAYTLLARTLRPLDPEATIVHVHGWTKALSASVARAAVAAGFRVVITLHEYFTVCPNGSFFIYPKQRICTLQPMGPRCVTTDCDSRSPALKAYRVVRQVAQARIGGIPSAVREYVSVSPFSAKILQPLLPVTARLHAVDNPVDAVPGPRTPAETHDAFVFVGRLSPEKGGALFARALAAAPVRARFIGAGEEAATIRELAPDAEHTGWLSPDDVRAELRRARVLVVPSIWYETFGLAVLEAAAAGVPTIVADTCAARDLVEDGVTGLHFRGGDVGDLARALAACRDDALVERLSRAAYDRYWQRPYSLQAHIDRLLQVYAEVLSGPPESPPATGADSGAPTRPLRIALVSRRVVRTEGQGRVNDDVVRAAVARGHEVAIVAEACSPELAALDGVRWHRIAIPPVPTQLAKNMFYALGTTRWLAAHRRDYDLVQADGFATFARTDVNAVHYLHGEWMHTKIFRAESTQGIRGAYQFVYTLVNTMLERGALKRTRYGIAVSDNVRQGLANLGLPPGRIEVIPNGVEPSHDAIVPLERAALGLPEGVFVALYAGDLQTGRKGLGTLLQAIALVPGLHLAVAGTLRSQRFPALAARLGIAERVHFTGFRADLPRVMAVADVFVMASHYEPFGLVVLEAMAAGTPVVTARCVGASSLVGESGVVLDVPDDPAAMARALAELAADPCRARAMGQAGVHIAARNTVATMAERYARFYERIGSGR